MPDIQTTVSEPVETSAPAAKRPGLSRTVIALGFVSLLTDISSEMVYTQVPLFLTLVLGAPASVVGLIEGVAESTASLMKLVSGRLSDRSGRRKPLTLLGYSFGAISKPLLALATIWPMVLALRFLDRLGKGFRTAPRDALIAESTPPEMRGRAFGLHRAMDTTGAVLGPLLGLWFLTHVSGDVHRLFLFAGLPGLLAVLTLFCFVHEKPVSKSAAVTSKPETPPVAPTTGAPAGITLWRTLSPAYRRFLIAVLVFSLGNSSDAFLILRAKTLGFGWKEMLGLYAVFNLVEAIFGYAAGILSDRVGRRPLIITGYLIFALVYLGLAFATEKWHIWALFVLYGGYYTLTQGVQRAFAADFASPEQRATQIGAYHTIVGLALLPASALAGLLFDRHVAAPFLIGAVAALLGAVLLATQPTPRKAAS